MYIYIHTQYKLHNIKTLFITILITYSLDVLYLFEIDLFFTIDTFVRSSIYCFHSFSLFLITKSLFYKNHSKRFHIKRCDMSITLVHCITRYYFTDTDID